MIRFIILPRGRAAFLARRKDSLTCAYSRKAQKGRIKSLLGNSVLMYGMGAGALAKKLGISKDEAKRAMKQFFAACPDIHQWMHRAVHGCETTGRVYTFLGRPRRLHEIHAVEEWVKARAKRQAVNSIIQGSAADFALWSMIKVTEDPTLQAMDCRLLLQVHDELVFSAPTPHATEACARVCQLMTYGANDGLRVDLAVSSHIVDNWSQAK